MLLNKLRKSSASLATASPAKLAWASRKSLGRIRRITRGRRAFAGFVFSARKTELICSSGSHSDERLVQRVEQLLEGMDKESWGAGPWTYEPDSYYTEYYGFPCYAQRHTSTGGWCGYIEIDQDHPWYGDDYADMRTAAGDYVGVHGGITFADWHVDLASGFLVGFDCAHGGDYAPASEARSRRSRGQLYGQYRALQYVLNEIKGLAQQAKAAQDAWA